MSCLTTWNNRFIFLFVFVFDRKKKRKSENCHGSSSSLMTRSFYWRIGGSMTLLHNSRNPLLIDILDKVVGRSNVCACIYACVQAFGLMWLNIYSVIIHTTYFWRSFQTKIGWKHMQRKSIYFENVDIVSIRGFLFSLCFSCFPWLTCKFYLKFWLMQLYFTSDNQSKRVYGVNLT